MITHLLESRVPLLASLRSEVFNVVEHACRKRRGRVDDELFNRVSNRVKKHHCRFLDKSCDHADNLSLRLRIDTCFRLSLP